MQRNMGAILSTARSFPTKLKRPNYGAESAELLKSTAAAIVWSV